MIYKTRQDFERNIVSNGYSLKPKKHGPAGNILVAEKYMSVPDTDLSGAHYKVAWFIERDDSIMIGRSMYTPVWDERNGFIRQSDERSRINMAVQDAEDWLNLYEDADGL